MSSEHSNNMEKESFHTEKDIPPESVQKEFSSGENESVRNDETPAKKPGAILAAKRAEAGISEEQMASRLKMTLRQIRHLEADNYEALHGIAISRGFVRAYARSLKIDPEPLVAMFGEKATPSASTKIKMSVQKSGESFVPNRMPFRKKNRSITGKFVIALIVLIIAAVVAWNMKLFSFAGKQNRKDMPEATLLKPADVPPSENRMPDAGNPNSQANTEQVQDTSKEAQPAADTGTGNTVKTDKTAQLAALAAMQTGSSERAVTGTEARLPVLKMNFSEKSWVRVQKQDGSVIAEYTGQPGDQRQLEVSEPVTVIVGYAPGVSMEFRGAPVNVAASAVNSVARISLK